MFIKKYLKWISTFLVLVGILLTNLNIYPLNIYFMDWELLDGLSLDLLAKTKRYLLTLDYKYHCS